MSVIACSDSYWHFFMGFWWWEKIWEVFLGLRWCVLGLGLGGGWGWEGWGWVVDVVGVVGVVGVGEIGVFDWGSELILFLTWGAKYQIREHFMPLIRQPPHIPRLIQLPPTNNIKPKQPLIRNNRITKPTIIPHLMQTILNRKSLPLLQIIITFLTSNNFHPRYLTFYLNFHILDKSSYGKMFFYCAFWVWWGELFFLGGEWLEDCYVWGWGLGWVGWGGWGLGLGLGGFFWGWVWGCVLDLEDWLDLLEFGEAFFWLLEYFEQFILLLVIIVCKTYFRFLLTLTLDLILILIQILISLLPIPRSLLTPRRFLPISMMMPMMSMRRSRFMLTFYRWFIRLWRFKRWMRGLWMFERWFWLGLLGLGFLLFWFCYDYGVSLYFGWLGRFWGFGWHWGLFYWGIMLLSWWFLLLLGGLQNLWALNLPISLPLLVPSLLISLPIAANNILHIIINLLLLLNFLKLPLNLTPLLLHTWLLRTPKTQNNTIMHITSNFRLLLHYFSTNHTLIY